MLAEQLLIILFTVFCPILWFVVLVIVILASFGKSIGIRRAYVKVLLKIFGYCGHMVKRDYDKRRNSLHDMNDEEIDDSELQLRRIRVESGSMSIIKREASERIMRKLWEGAFERPGRVWTIIDDNLDFLKSGIEAIIEDEVTSRFLAEELPSWNFLTRTSVSYQHINWKLGIIWGIGVLYRYFLLLPGRLVLLVIGLTWLFICTAAIGYLKDGSLKRWLNWHVSIICNRIVAHSVSAIITYHNVENRAQPGGICVANHTSPIDVMILSCDGCYSLIGQSHGGLLGMTQRALGRAGNHIWFERSEAKDRQAVTKRIKAHTLDKTKLPILIFPEGTCINNTSVMMFKKGSFEVGSRIYPAAIKYDPLFGDPFWNSSEHGWTEYLLRMMTSWAIVADVWYLPPMDKRPHENAVDFANRVKKVIAEAGGLVDLEWDGQLKRNPVSAKMIQKQQELYWQRLNRVDSRRVFDPNHFVDSGTESDEAEITDRITDSLIFEEKEE